MQVQALSCDKCGAPLDVGASTNFVTCAHCGSRLHVMRTGNAAYTEEIAAIKRDTSEVLSRTNVILGQNRDILREMEVNKLNEELKDLNQKWNSEARRWFAGYYDGKKRIPALEVAEKRLKVWTAILIAYSIVFVIAIMGAIRFGTIVTLAVFALVFFLLIGKILRLRKEVRYVEAYDNAYLTYQSKFARIESDMDRL